ncbi:MAG TPA: EAL domain-containing protein, partial [Nakamurella sp.]
MIASDAAANVPVAVVPGGPVRTPGSSWRRPSVIICAVFVLALALATCLAGVLVGSDSSVASAVNDVGQLAAAAIATATAGVAVTRHAGPHRRAWLLVAAACGSWTIGQLDWCYYEVIRAEEIPQVSIADLFFLVFPALMAVAVWPVTGRRIDRLRTLLDAFIIGMSLFVISWTTSINQVASTANDDLPGLLINLAYPCADIVVLTIVLISASRRFGHRSALTAVAAAMALIAVSDGFYAYLSASSTFEPGSVTGLGWTVGFGLIGCAALAGGQRAAQRESTPAADSRPAVLQLQRASMLPYVPLALALIIVIVERINNGNDRVTGVVVIVTFVGVLLRQYLTIRDNVTLTLHLANRERELERQAFADRLTGLPNRALFTDRVAHALEHHRRGRRRLALLFVDLDDFKAVNDTLGHPVGDELVIRVAERLLGAVRASDTVARFGGDEFAVLVEGDTDAVEVGARLVESLRAEFVLGGEHLSVGASVGIAEVVADQETPELDELFSRADIAMYAAKRAGKGQLALYEPSMVLPEAADLHYRPLLVDAMRAGAIDCAFQPIIEVQSGRVHCVEALARWRVGEESVAQEYFIQLARRLGLLPALTDLMLDKACAQLADWSTRFDRTDLLVGVNVSPGLMTDRDFPRRVAEVLRRHGLGPDRLVLEVTEDALLGEMAIARVVTDRLRQLGVQLWLDDFGTGHSSLLNLRQIALQAVKIDIAFVATIDTDPEAERFLRALLALSRDLDLLVT